MLVKIDADVMKYIMEKLESIDEISNTECDKLNKSQLSAEVMKREAALEDIWELLDNETKGQL